MQERLAIYLKLNTLSIGPLDSKHDDKSTEVLQLIRYLTMDFFSYGHMIVGKFASQDTEAQSTECSRWLVLGIGLDAGRVDNREKGWKD